MGAGHRSEMPSPLRGSRAGAVEPSPRPPARFNHSGVSWPNFVRTNLGKITMRTPTWFKVVAVLALLWNLLGCLAFSPTFVFQKTSPSYPRRSKALFPIRRPCWALVARKLPCSADVESMACSCGVKWAFPCPLFSPGYPWFRTLASSCCGRHEGWRGLGRRHANDCVAIGIGLRSC